MLTRRFGVTAVAVVFAVVFLGGCGCEKEEEETPPSPSVTVTSPNGGETWVEAEVRDVTWTTTGTVGDVDIAYSTDGGTTWTDISSGEANDGSYSWTIPAGVNSSQCRVRVQEADGDPADMSDANFTIVPIGVNSITVSSPNGGESWTEGESHDVTWTWAGTVGNVDIAYSDDGGTTWTDISTGEANDGSYTWTIPGGVDSANCLVRVQEADGDPTDTSDASFTIVSVPVSTITVAQPNGGETWYEGETHVITWTTTGTVGDVRISYSTGVPVVDIAVNEFNDGTYTWTIPAGTASNTVRIRVQEMDGDPTDMSDGTFIILPPSIVVTAPNGGEVWTAGTTEDITWTSAGVLGTVDIHYSIDGGTTWLAVASGEADDGTCEWNVPPPSSTTCLVRVQDSGGAPADDSDAVFEIQYAGTIRRVDATAAGVGDGSTWADACTTIQAALALVASGDEIWVAAGTYVRNGADTVVATMVGGVSMYGGFEGWDGGSGAQETSRGERDPAANVTIINGDADDTPDSGDEVWHCVVGASSATIDGFTIQAGDADGGAAPDNTAGGLLIGGLTDFTVSNCTFEGNVADSNGGAIAIDSSALITINDCRFNLNACPQWGGAIHSSNAAPVIIGCDFYSNDISWGGGAGAHFAGGAGMPPAVVDRCSFRENNGYNGGAISTDLELNLSNTIFYGNTAEVIGAGVFIGGGMLTARNCTFYGNHSNGSFAGAIGSWGGPATVFNCILRNNTYPLGILEVSSATTVSYCNIDQTTGYTDAGGNFDADPMYADAAAGDFHLTAGSPCIDAGDGDQAPAVDCDNMPRKDDPGMANTGTGTPDYADVGAHEFQGVTPLRVITPNGGETWTVGDTIEITWFSDGMSNVQIELSRDGGSTWEEIVASTDATAYSYTWTGVTGPGSGTCVVRINEIGGGGASDSSDLPFHIESTEDWYVDGSVAVSGDGKSWAAAFKTLQEGAAAAGYGDTVHVAEGSYYRAGADDFVLQMREGIDILGGYPTGGGVRDPSLNVTVLDGDIGGGNNVNNVVFGANDATLDGFTIVNGNADDGAVWVYGGGVLLCNTSPTISNCAITQCDANLGGAGMLCYGALCSATISDCTFTSITAGGGNGSGLLVTQEARPTITGCTFDSNTTTGTGGAIYVQDYADPTIENCTFSSNSSSFSAGAVGFVNCILTNPIRGCTFDGNTAGGFGGATQLNSGITGMRVDFRDCFFLNNQATGATSRGGAVNLFGSSSGDFVNCVFYNNLCAGDNRGGGGIYNGGEDVAAINCSFNANQATGTPGEGGAVYNDTGTVTITNCILWGDSGTSDNEVHNETGTVTMTYSDVEGCGGAGTNLDADPVFVGAGDLHLDVGSPCIDAADGDAAPAQDIEANDRYDNTTVGDTGTGTPTYVDIGAFERQTSP